MSGEESALHWLLNDVLVKVERNASGYWRLYFESGASMLIGCLWRKLDQGAIVCTSEDHGHRFGLPAPLDAVAALGALSGHRITSVDIRRGTADILLTFGDAGSLELITDSAGYESWEAMHPTHGQVIACSGGRLEAVMPEQFG